MNATWIKVKTDSETHGSEQTKTGVLNLSKTKITFLQFKLTQQQLVVTITKIRIPYLIVHTQTHLYSYMGIFTLQ
jgi:hypothetical protein